MTDATHPVSGRAPAEWEAHLERCAGDPVALTEALSQMAAEMRRERSWLHDNPPVGGLLSAILEFFARPEDNDVEALSRQLESELRAERTLKERYRSWLPGEDYLDVLFPYLKSFGGEVHVDEEGVQFPEYVKVTGLKTGGTRAVVAFFVHERFPGRDPANFQLAFDTFEGTLVAKRAYKMDLKASPDHPSVGRAVLGELIRVVCPNLSSLRRFIVDNAANRATRDDLLIRVRSSDDDVRFGLRPGFRPDDTLLGRLMRRLVGDLGLTAGPLHASVGPFGTLRFEMAVHPQLAV